ncbi:CoA transferase [Rhodococcus fascians]|nr:CoA transferase [Rhodococcus fascians]MBY4140939.1 CoA transferase [Rhodococcus fascians]MBY4219603.1 CoA transferase [Rhodococcus fascians]MBY4221912.1 CoA transferase [Rhodococcus fascians]MBY4233913.1 CoA transferase [Rhodococcus fascians]
MPEARDDWLASGVPVLTGRPDGPAVVPVGSAATSARVWAQFVSATFAPGAELDGRALLAERAALTGWVRRGKESLGRGSRLLRTADGWAAVSSVRADDPALLGAMICEPLSGEPWLPVADWLSTRSRVEIDERMDLLGIAGRCMRRKEAVTLPLPNRSRSMAGATVVDFSALWAGPLCAHLLGLAGARVIKVETPQRPDGARRGNHDFYELLHGGHESVVLDPTRAFEREAMRALVASADVVIESSRPRALRRFGLEAERFVDAGCTWISITADGRGSNRIGFGDDIAAGAGLIAHDDDGSPMFAGDAIADPLTGIYGAVCAVDAQNEAGGRLWDVSMTDVVSSTLSPESGGRVGSGQESIDLERRKGTGSAPLFGASTGRVLCSLGFDL